MCKTATLCASWQYPCRRHLTQTRRKLRRLSAPRGSFLLILSWHNTPLMLDLACFDCCSQSCCHRIFRGFPFHISLRFLRLIPFSAQQIFPGLSCVSSLLPFESSFSQFQSEALDSAPPCINGQDAPVALPAG